MDPVSLTGLAIGVASIGLQVYTSCIQGMSLHYHYYTRPRLRLQARGMAQMHPSAMPSSHARVSIINYCLS